MKFLCLAPAICAVLAVVASSTGCSSFYCYSTPKIDLGVAQLAEGLARVGDDAEVTPLHTEKSL